jgi:hypothetical protein
MDAKMGNFKAGFCKLATFEWNHRWTSHQIDFTGEYFAARIEAYALF